MPVHFPTFLILTVSAVGSVDTFRGTSCLRTTAKTIAKLEAIVAVPAFTQPRPQTFTALR